jgi:hypothetical protein
MLISKELGKEFDKFQMAEIKNACGGQAKYLPHPQKKLKE